ncbi:hypothetical protein SMD44_07114 [Streptomyces alboflavus]|uniref:Uncharacterized protein n=1 Tax=Streptomyces alboflavus TaxID=67267 RepID=A0A1Z1WMH5_9ACTN|nr:hypothetical protein SMD44_07114 [Streptomyces alboflavus]
MAEGTVGAGDAAGVVGGAVGVRLGWVAGMA